MYRRTTWSADVKTVDELLRRVDGSNIRWVKIDRLFVRRNGDAGDKVFQTLHEMGIETFGDPKISEVGDKLVENFRVEFERARPTMINCMAGGAASSGLLLEEIPEDVEDRESKVDGLKRFADLCHEYGVRPCAVTVLTSKSKDFVKKEFNGRTALEQVLFYVELLLKCGVHDVVCSTLELPILRSVSRFAEMRFHTPGIRRPESSSESQARTGTPAWGYASGGPNDNLVVGKDLTKGKNGDNPNTAQNLEDLVDEALEALSVA